LKLLEIITKLTLIRDIRLHSMHKRVHTQTHERHGSILFRLWDGSAEDHRQTLVRSLRAELSRYRLKIGWY